MWRVRLSLFPIHGTTVPHKKFWYQKKMPSRKLYSAASIAMFFGILACIGIVSVLQNGGGNMSQVLGGTLLIIASSLITCGGRCCQCRPIVLLYNVQVLSFAAITCHVISFILTIVLTLPWWNKLNESNLGWVNGLIVYGMVIDVLSILAAFYLIHVTRKEIRALQTLAPNVQARRIVSRQMIRNNLR